MNEITKFNVNDYFKPVDSVPRFGQYKPLYIQNFYENCPKEPPMVGTQECPAYHVGYYLINSDTERISFSFPYSEILSIFEGEFVNIWAEDFGLFRKVLFSKQSVTKLLGQ